MKITVDVEDVSDIPILKREITTGTIGGRELQICTGIPMGSPVIMIGDKWYQVSMKQIIEKIIEEES